MTVTAPDDDDAVGRTVSLTHFVSEPGYVSRPATLAVTVVDDDTAALVLSETELGVTEQETGGSFTVALASAPTAPVTVTVASPAESGLTIAGTPLTFHSGNWADGQTVTVAADDDADADGKEVTLTLTAAGAAEYAALEAYTVAVTVADNDAAGIGLSATELELDEGGEARYGVRLTARPAGDVEVRVAGMAGTDLTVAGPDNADLGAAGAALVFTPDDWDAERTVTVTAGADPDTADDKAVLVHRASAVSGDYAAPPREVTVTVRDTDTPGAGGRGRAGDGAGSGSGGGVPGAGDVGIGERSHGDRPGQCRSRRGRRADLHGDELEQPAACDGGGGCGRRRGRRHGDADARPLGADYGDAPSASRRHRPALKAQGASRSSTSWRPSRATYASSSGVSAFSSVPSST